MTTHTIRLHRMGWQESLVLLDGLVEAQIPG